MGPVRSDERNSGGSCCRAQNPRPDGRRRGLHRWEFRTIEKRGSKIGKTKRGKGSKIMAVANRHGLPVAICVESATPHEVKLATNTLVQMVILVHHFRDWYSSVAIKIVRQQDATKEPI